METEFAYKVLPEGKLASDNTSSDLGAYIKLTLDVTEEYATEKYDIKHKDLIPFVSEQLNIEECRIQPVSIEEYDTGHS